MSSAHVGIHLRPASDVDWQSASVLASQPSPTFVNTWITAHMAAAKAIGKPFIVEEVRCGPSTQPLPGWHCSRFKQAHACQCLRRAGNTAEAVLCCVQFGKDSTSGRSLKARFCWADAMLLTFLEFRNQLPSKSPYVCIGGPAAGNVQFDPAEAAQNRDPIFQAVYDVRSSLERCQEMTDPSRTTCLRFARS